MDELDAVLRDATAAVEHPYFLLPIDGGNLIYRERVYCYELYHQMRLRWPENCPFLLNGEVDKGAHPILRAMRADYAKPDFLVHTPGNMAGNHAIIEVKSQEARTADIGQDLRKLSKFKVDVGYTRAIYLIYGTHADRKAEHIHHIMKSSDGLTSIELWIHQSPLIGAVRKI